MISLNYLKKSEFIYDDLFDFYLILSLLISSQSIGIVRDWYLKCQCINVIPWDKVGKFTLEVNLIYIDKYLNNFSCLRWFLLHFYYTLYT